MDDSILSLILFVALLGLAAFFAIAETALSSVSKSKIKVAAERGDNRAVKAIFVLDNFDRAITTLLICTNIVHISAATIVTVAVTRMWGLGVVTLSTIITTIVVFFAGEMLPKSIAKKHSYNLTLATVGPVKFCMLIFKPLALLLAHIGQVVASATGSEAEVTFTEEELVDLIEDLEEEGAIDEEQSDLLQATMDFSDTWVKHIMTEMSKVAALDADGTPEQLHAQIVSSNHSRIPVYEEEKTNVIGVLQIRKYMREYLGMQEDAGKTSQADNAGITGKDVDADNNRAGKDQACAPADKKYPVIREIMDPVYYVNRNTPINDVLERMSHRKLNMAVIQGTDMMARGVVTIEDILEELVGDIYDESDDIPKRKKGGAK